MSETVNSENYNIKEVTNFECDSNVTNIFIKQKITMIFIDYILDSHYSQFYFEYNHNTLRNFESIQVGNDFNIFYYLYLAKLTSKQPYQSDCHVCVKSYPKCSIMISLMLLLCGDTGTLSNPGPVYRNITDNCNLCESKIRSNVRSQCIECKAVFHQKCATPKNSTIFQCNLCTIKLLPFNNTDISNEPNSSNPGSSFMNLNSNSQFDFSDAKKYECFARKGLHFVHANVRSIFHKMSDLKMIAKQSNCAVIGITETWLDSTYTDSCVSIDGYNLIRRDRDGHAGGVCAYIRDDLAFNVRQDLNNSDLEDLWLEILLPKSKPLYIGICYRTNNNNKFLDCLESTLSKLRSDCDFLILGDINICLIKNKSKLCNEYKKLLRFFGCKQII